ncbi:MAG: class I SAM-dependent methyltransferase [Planctomycetota bacterium]
MSQKLTCETVGGIKCYSSGVADSYTDYPDAGFDVTDKLEADSFWVRSRNRLIKHLVHKYASRTAKTRFLDIGCGTGAVIQGIIDDANLEITGSEIYLKGLLYAKSKLPRVDFIQFDVTQGILPAQFDMIGAFDVIEHIENDVAAIANIHEMLSDDGYFIVTVPQYMFLWSKLDTIVKHKRRYSKKELLLKLRQQGFAISYSSSFLFALFPLMLISRLLDRKDSGNKADMEFEKRVRFPKVLNWIFDKIMRIDEVLIRLGVSLPCGGSLLVVAKKRRATDTQTAKPA